jgi:hypothetical protein
MTLLNRIEWRQRSQVTVVHTEAKGLQRRDGQFAGQKRFRKVGEGGIAVNIALTCTCSPAVSGEARR